MNQMRGDSMVINNKAYRFSGYKQYTFWVHNYLGKGVRKSYVLVLSGENAKKGQ